MNGINSFPIMMPPELNKKTIEEEFSCRLAIPDDRAELVRLRKIQLIDEGIEPSIDIDAELNAFFRDMLGNGTLIEWLVLDGNEIIATAAIMWVRFPPSYTNPDGRRGYITNMYTHPAYRKRGIASFLLTKLVQEARSAGVMKLWLGASTLGRPVYQRFGFADRREWLDLDVRDMPSAG